MLAEQRVTQSVLSKSRKRGIVKKEVQDEEERRMRGDAGGLGQEQAGRFTAS